MLSSIVEADGELLAGEAAIHDFTILAAACEQQLKSEDGKPSRLRDRVEQCSDVFPFDKRSEH